MFGNAWFWLAALCLILWGVAAFAQKLAAERCSAECCLLWFNLASVPISALIILTTRLNWGLAGRPVGLCTLAGILGAVGTWTSFAAMGQGGKASVVVPLLSLYPALSILLALVFLRETISKTQGFGIALAICATFLLSSDSSERLER